MQITLRELAGNDGTNPVIVGQGAFAGIDSAVALAMIFIEAVALETFVRKDRSHVAIELDLLRQRRFARECDAGEENEAEENGGQFHRSKRWHTAWGAQGGAATTQQSQGSLRLPQFESCHKNWKGMIWRP